MGEPIKRTDIPLGGISVFGYGSPPETAGAVMILIHGRGATAEGILELARDLQAAAPVSFLAPQAPGHTWYPYSFLAPFEQNEPYLSNSLQVLDQLVRYVTDEAGVDPGRLFLLGFSQGACLALEYAARFDSKPVAVIGLSGGLIGPPGGLPPYKKDLSGTEVFIGCGDRDAHIPEERVHESAEVFRRLGATVTKRIYPGMGHTINEDEIVFIQELLDGLTKNHRTGMPAPSAG